MNDPSPIPPSPRLTPKRKRDDLVSEQHISPSPMRGLLRLTTPIFSFQPPNHVDHVYDAPEDGSSSPRTKVAQKFRDLALAEAPADQGPTKGDKPESGGGATTSAANVNNNDLKFLSTPSPNASIPDADAPNNRSDNSAANMTMEFYGGEMQIDEENDGVTRKRLKCDQGEESPQFVVPDISTGPKGETSANAAIPLPTTETPDALPAPLQDAIDPAVVRISRSGASGRLQKSYPSINRLQDSKSRNRKRAGTPPVAKRKVMPEQRIVEQEGEEPEVVDPVRAALTWHEDEITVYDPEDKDDDRRGMDGIGFRPTPAIAYQREQMRRRQLVEYRRREENEARARRNQRRREQFGGGGGISEIGRSHSIPRVRFSESEPASVVTN